jgi:methionyl-tRNA formyltransferase
MRIVFLGTPEFAVPSLLALANNGHEIAAAFTQPDRPKGRGNQITESPVKKAATELRIPVYQPERVRRPEVIETLRNLRAEMMVVVGYGQIIPQAIIDLPRYGILNVHASLLPKYRGAAPIQWSVANGDAETGVTIMQIDAGLDTGDMLLKGAVAIRPDETAPQLSQRLAPLGADLLITAVRGIEAGTTAREKQENAAATYARLLKKEDGLIDWGRNAAEICNRLRGFTPWPGAYSSFRGQQVSVIAARALEGGNLRHGSLYSDRKRLLVACGENTSLQVDELQLAGKKRMEAGAFLNGYKLEANERLGEQL